MNEKIKVTVPKSIHQLLLKDADSFRVVKGDGTPNLNAFINHLILHFYEEFAADEKDLRDRINEALFSVPEKYKTVAYEQVLRAVARRDKVETTDEESVAISFKPTKTSEYATIYIENVLLQNESLASFYRRMFISYARKPKNEREKIIHKQVYELLVRSVKEGVNVCLSLDSGQVYPCASIYSIDPGKDELFNFVLFYNGKISGNLSMILIF